MDSKIRERLLKYYHSKKNKYQVQTPDFYSFSGNPNCGDSIAMAGRLGEGDVITEIAYQGNGCVLSQAAAGILADYAKGKNLSEIKSLSEETYLRDVIGVTELGPNRKKCATMAFETLKAAIEDYEAKMKELRKRTEEEDIFEFDF